jgi:hypothetical protein
MIFSHRALRYAAPFLHLAALGSSFALLRRGRVYALGAGAQVALLGAGFAGGRIRSRPLLVARYYVLTTASLAAGLWDWLASGTTAGWEPAQGTR